jgi:hypothetical protein
MKLVIKFNPPQKKNVNKIKINQLSNPTKPPPKRPLVAIWTAFGCPGGSQWTPRLDGTQNRPLPPSVRWLLFGRLLVVLEAASGRYAWTVRKTVPSPHASAGCYLDGFRLP